MAQLGQARPHAGIPKRAGIAGDELPGAVGQARGQGQLQPLGLGGPQGHQPDGGAELAGGPGVEVSLHQLSGRDLQTQARPGPGGGPGQGGRLHRRGPAQIRQQLAEGAPHLALLGPQLGRLPLGQEPVVPLPHRQGGFSGPGAIPPGPPQQAHQLRQAGGLDGEHTGAAFGLQPGPHRRPIGKPAVLHQPFETL